MISAVGAVLPAHNEADRIETCLESIKAALERLPSGVDSAIWVVVDRSSDGTAEVVERALAGCPRSGLELSCQPRPVGSLRHRGVLEVLRLLRPHTPARTWLLNTDADSQVPTDWALRHLRYAGTGAHAVAGLVRLTDPQHLHPQAVRRYQALLESRQRKLAHGHVYGANLGIRGDAYLEVGGFGPRSTGEDADVVRRLGLSGFQVAHASDVWVSTSARLSGRAKGGLADLLGQLQREAIVGGSSGRPSLTA
jgi:glycosyltransferase involved in cell wall biosynthesis